MSETSGENQIQPISIASSAMLIELSVKAWPAVKTDRKVSEEVDAAKNTQTRAGSYQKNLMAGTKLLHDINKFAARIRSWNSFMTLPWNDNGMRLLPSSKFFDYTAAMAQHRAEYEEMVDEFIRQYDDMIAAAALNLGDMFDRSEYPPVEEVKRRFQFNFTISPLPVSGDFRVDIGNKANEDLQRQFEERFTERVADAMRENWQRLYECLKHISDRLEVSASGDRKVFRDTIISNAQELCDLLKHMNITNDPTLESARRELEDAVGGLNAEDMRQDELMRDDVKKRVDTILSKFQF